MKRLATIVLLAAAGLGLAALPAQARREHRKAASDTPQATEKKADSSKPVQVATFGDWGAYTAKSGKARTCYALASPKERKPDLKREAAYVFISDRPGEKVHNEVSIIMGFPVRDNGKAEAKIGRSAFDLVTKGSNAWIRNPEDEAKFVEALQHSGTLVVRAAAAKGAPTVDSYALDGFKQALARVSKECK